MARSWGLRTRRRPTGRIARVPVTITDPDDPRVADYRDLKAGDRPAGAPRGTSPVIVEGTAAIERLLLSPYRIRSVFGVPGRVEALGVPDDVDVYVADKWVLSEVIGFRLTRGALASADRLPPADLGELLRGPDPAAPRRLAVLEGLNDHENLGSIARSAVALGIEALLLDPRCADPLYRRSVRVSMGHVLTLPFAVLPDWPAGLDRLHDAGYLTVALTPAADAVDLADVDPAGAPAHGGAAGRGGAGADAGGAAGRAGAGADPHALRRRLPRRRAAAAVAFATLR